MLTGTNGCADAAPGIHPTVVYQLPSASQIDLEGTGVGGPAKEFGLGHDMHGSHQLHVLPKVSVSHAEEGWASRVQVILWYA